MLRIYLIVFINIFSQLLIFAIFVRVVLSWFRTNPAGGLNRFFHDITEPVLSFFRRFTPRLGMIDISPFIAFLAIEILRALFLGILTV